MESEPEKRAKYFSTYNSLMETANLNNYDLKENQVEKGSYSVPRVLSGKWTSPWGFHVNLFNFLVAHSEPKHFRVIHLPGRQNFSYVDLVGRQSYPGLPSPSHW